MVTTWQKYHPHLLLRTMGLRMKRLIDETKATQIEAGVFEDASPHVRAAMLVAEYGNSRSNVPARYPISKAIGSNAKEFKKDLRKLARVMVLRACGRKMNTLGSANRIAKIATKLLQKHLLNFLPPPLSPRRLRTKLEKNYTKPTLPLYATGELYLALKGRVKSK